MKLRIDIIIVYAKVIAFSFFFMRPPLTVLPGGKSADASASASAQERFPSCANDFSREMIEDCRRRVAQAAHASFMQCSLFEPLNALGAYTYINEARGLIVMVFVVKRQQGPTEYWKVFGGVDPRLPEQLPRRPDKHEAVARAMTGSSPEGAQLVGNIMDAADPEDYYQNP